MEIVDLHAPGNMTLDLDTIQDWVFTTKDKEYKFNKEEFIKRFLEVKD